MTKWQTKTKINISNNVRLMSGVRCLPDVSEGGLYWRRCGRVIGAQRGLELQWGDIGQLLDWSTLLLLNKGLLVLMHL